MPHRVETAKSGEQTEPKQTMAPLASYSVVAVVGGHGPSLSQWNAAGHFTCASSRQALIHLASETEQLAAVATVACDPFWPEPDWLLPSKPRGGVSIAIVGETLRRYGGW